MQTVVYVYLCIGSRKSAVLPALYIYIPYSGIFSASAPSLASIPTAVSLASAGEYTTPTTALALMLNSLTGDLPQAAKDMVFISSGLPTVPKQLLEKIQHWEYVDPAELLPAPSTYDECANPPVKFTLFPGCEILRPRRRQIESIIDWVKAFTVCSAALLQKHPDQRNELLAYQLTIIRAAQQYDGLNGGLMTLTFALPQQLPITKHGPSLIQIYTLHSSRGGRNW